MKWVCEKCRYEMSENQTRCPECGFTVFELKYQQQNSVLAVFKEKWKYWVVLAGTGVTLYLRHIL